MSEVPDINTSHSDTYKEIYVTGQISTLNYDGLKLAVLNDTADLTKTLQSDRFQISKVIINRHIECTLNLSPQTLKAWALLLNKELNRYEKTFGHILSPEEVNQKFQESR